MTKQEIFDKVATHLLKQGERSLLHSGGQCAYRGKDGLMCAIGCLIPDEKYFASMEGRHVSMLAIFLMDCLRPTDRDRFVTFLWELQSIHDKVDPAKWRDALNDCAKMFGLDASVLGKEENA